MKEFNLFNNARWLLMVALAAIVSTNVGAVTTGTINFGTTSGYTNINGTSVSGDDSQGSTWTVTTVFPSSTSFTPQPGYNQVGSKNTPATSITFTATLASSQRITGFSAKFGGNSDTEGDVTLKVGSTVVGTGRLRGNEDVVVNCSSWLEGNSLTVIVNNISRAVKCYYISYSYGETMYPITWRVNGGAASGSPTTSVPNGWKVTALPTTPTSANCDNSKVFVGWSASAIDGETNTRPSDLFSTPEEAPTVSAAATYYAVFATQTGSSTLLSEDFAGADKGNNNTLNNSGTAWDGNSNFGTTERIYQAGGVVKFASSSYAGYIITKQLTAAVGTVLSISFDIKGWDAVESDIEVSGNNDEFTAPPAIRYSNKYNESFENKSVNVVLTSANPYIKIYSGGRCFMDNLVIVGTTYADYATTCCDAPETALSITGGSTVAIGNTLSLGTSGGNDGTVSWSVEAGTGAATVNSSGVVTPSSAGTVTIKAHQDANGDACPQDAEKEVTITVNVSSVSVDPTSKSIVTEETFTITPTISPSNATDKTVSWSSSATGKATVSSGTVTGVAAGNATITCTTNNGSKTAACAVTVYAVTTAVKNDGGTDISASVGLPTRTGASIAPAADANGYIFKEWQITNASLGSSATTKSNTITSPTGAVTLTAIYWEKKKVTWIVNGEELTSGSQSTAVAYGTQYKDLTYPSDPVVDCGDRFVGWTTSNMGSVLGQSAPTPLLTVDNRGSNTTAINADVTFYAVFADYDD